MTPFYIRNVSRALIIYQNKVLVLKYQDNKGDMYYIFPGGAQEFGEDSFDAVRRECQEELGLYFLPDQLASCVLIREMIGAKRENPSPFAKDKHFKELYFVIELQQMPSIKITEKEILKAEFVDFDALEGMNIKPYYVRNHMKDLVCRHHQNLGALYIGDAL